MDSKFKPGQIWRYKTRPGEEHSRVTILLVESDTKLGTIVHVAADKLAIQGPDGVATTISHLPYQEQALAESVTDQDGTASGPPKLDGYAEWKAAFDRGQAGIWTLSVAEAIGAMESVLTQS